MIRPCNWGGNVRPFCGGKLMHKAFRHPAVLALGIIALFVLGICLPDAFTSDGFLGKLLPSLSNDPFVSKPVLLVSGTMMNVACILACVVTVRSILSLFGRGSWPKRSSLAAIVLIGCATAWTVYRLDALKYYGGGALFTTAEAEPFPPPPRRKLIVAPLPTTMTTSEPRVIGKEGRPGETTLTVSSTSKPTTSPKAPPGGP